MYWRRMYAKGKPHPPYNKVFQGCGLTLGIIIILIGPILLFSDITPLSAAVVGWLASVRRSAEGRRPQRGEGHVELIRECGVEVALDRAV